MPRLRVDYVLVHEASLSDFFRQRDFSICRSDDDVFYLPNLLRRRFTISDGAVVWFCVLERRLTFQLGCEPNGVIFYLTNDGVDFARPVLSSGENFLRFLVCGRRIVRFLGDRLYFCAICFFGIRFFFLFRGNDYFVVVTKDR